MHTDFWASEARLSGQSVCVLWFELRGSVEGFLGNPNESGFRDVPSLAADRVPFSFMQFAAELQMCGYIFFYGWLRYKQNRYFISINDETSVQDRSSN